MDDERELQVRVSDAEREAVVSRLSEACGEGRITLAEFTERTDGAYAARTRADLEKLTADLPGLERTSSTPTGGSLTVRPTGQTVPGRRRRRTAVLSGFELRGRWHVDPEMSVVCVLGGAKLDLREAELGGPQVRIKIVSVCGGAQVVVPHGVHVDVDGVNFLGGYSAQQPNTTPPPGAPTIHIHTVNVMGGVSVEFD